MSRIGKKPITIPAGVTVNVDGNNKVVVEGSKGKLEQQINKLIKVIVKDGVVTLEKANETTEANSMHGLYRTLINNMIIGVTQGFSKLLAINGVGYKAVQKGDDIEMNLGFSHPVVFKTVEGIKLSCPSPLEIKVEGISKEQVGQIAANIRAIRPVEPYHAYGIRYSDEVVLRKEGKKAGK
jgi:large subunit ribosomal protein L6